MKSIQMILALFFVMAFAAVPLPFEVHALGSSLQNENTSRTVWDRVYTEEQALRGEEHFTRDCMYCHDGQADGPELDSDDFTNRWREDSLAPLFSYMKTKMPEDFPGSLEDSEYLDILSYVLWLNRFPSGTANLTPESLSRIQFVGMDGPRPLPAGTLVYAVGCLTTTGNQQWDLTSAGAPSRTRNIQETEEGFRELEASPLGTARVRLEGVAQLRPALDTERYRETKVFAKGLFTYQDSQPGIEVMEIRPLTAACRAAQ